MSPKEIKNLRESHLGITQKSMAEALGLTTLTMSQYETGVRNPGATVLILFMILNSFPKKKAIELLELFRSTAMKMKQHKKPKEP